MDGGKLSPRSYKVKVIQEYEVEIFYQQGMIADSEDEATEIAYDQCIELAYEEEGLCSSIHDETETLNGFIGYVRTHDPRIELVYTLDDMTTNIKRELTKKGIKHD